MRPPDLTIGPADDPQTKRWHLLQWRGIQVALHKWYRSDHDRALHDHKADNISILLWGRYREWFSHGWEAPRWKLRLPFIPYFRKAETPHRVELHRGGPVWTLWIRFRERRRWGFWCKSGWMDNADYLSARDYSAPGSVSTVGRGCD